MAFMAAILPFLSSCVNDLDVVPLDDDEVTTATFYSSQEEYTQVIAKLYAGLAITGQQGPAGAPDIAGLDEGSQASYLRMYWTHQELPTEEAIIAWNDQTIKDFHNQSWGASDPFILGMYSRLFFQIALANEFIRESADGKISGFDAGTQELIRGYRAEARFLRALSYWHALDLFDGNVPFVTEADEPGAFLPPQTNAQDLFSYIEGELLEIGGDNSALPEPMSNEFARADKAAVWMLLSKLYLNAEVYIGQDRYSDAAEYASKVINAGYSLDSNYEHLFMLNNETSNEIIFRIAFDGQRSQSFGGMTFLIYAALAGDMNPADFGVGGGWGGIRSTSALVNKFDEQDGRAQFYTDGRTLEIEDVSTFTDGFSVVKYKNLRDEGDTFTSGSNPEFPDTDFPMFRLGDAYLMYAEAAVRGASGADAATAVSYINELRERAFGDDSQNITAADLSLDFILDERSRELYWECHRRTDLRRHGKLTGGEYLWPWKGGVKEGRATDEKYNIFPLPASDVSANPNLTQNPGY